MADNTCPQQETHSTRRIAVLGAFANPNVGDEAILDITLERIWNAFGNNAIVTVLTKDEAYTTPLIDRFGFKCEASEALHRISVEEEFAFDAIYKRAQAIIGEWDDENPEDTLTPPLHTIFDGLDVLHIAGGGYANSMWPDMLCETWLAANLANMSGASVVVSGADWDPISDEHLHFVQDIAGIAKVVDFRDTSGAALSDRGVDFHGRKTDTLDDAIGYMTNHRDETGKYAAFCIQPPFGGEDVDKYNDMVSNAIVPFMSDIIASGTVESIKLLSFSSGDFEAVTSCEGYKEIESWVKLVDLVGRPARDALNIVSGAVFNVGTRFHQSIMSLTAGVPAFGIYCGEYYENKLASAFGTWGEDTFCSYKDLTLDRLQEFSSSRQINDMKRRLSLQQPSVDALYQEKIQILAQAYSIEDGETNMLARRMMEDWLSDKPLVSVIVPAYNACLTLSACLRSITRQSLRNLEIIVVDDGSTDRTQEVLSAIAWEDKRIKIIKQENAGVSAARNKGLSEACGEYVLFCDADDQLASDYAIEQLFHAAVSNNVVAAGGSFVEVDISTGQKQTEFGGNLAKYKFKEHAVMSYRDFQFDFGWIRFLYNREFIVEHWRDFSPLTYYEDPVWFTRTMHCAGTFAVIPDPIYHYRIDRSRHETLTPKKAVDLCRGIYINLVFARNNGYNMLFDTTLTRLTKDYAQEILYHAVESGDDRTRSEIADILNDISALVYGKKSGKHIACELGLNAFRNVDGLRIHQLEEANQRQQEAVSEAVRNANRPLIDEITALREELADMVEENKVLLEALNMSECETAELRASTTWKLGNALLAGPKKAKDAVNRMRG